MIISSLDPALADLSLLSGDVLESFVADAVLTRPPAVLFALSQSVVGELFVDGNYPTYSTLVGYARRHQFSVLDIVSIARIYQAWAEPGNSIEAFAAIEDFDFADPAFDGQAYPAGSPGLISRRQRTVFAASLLCDSGRCPVVFLLAPGFVDDRVVTKAGTVIISKDGNVLDRSPYENTIELFGDMERAYLALDAGQSLAKLHGRADDAIMETAILLELKGRSGLPMRDLVCEPMFSFANCFVTSVNQALLGDNPSHYRSLLRACVDAILGERMEKVHDVRETAKPGSTQQTWEGMRAWRRDVTTEYHLHYWMNSAGHPRFVNFGVHNDFDMPKR